MSFAFPAKYACDIFIRMSVEQLHYAVENFNAIVLVSTQSRQNLRFLQQIRDSIVERQTFGYGRILTFQAIEEATKQSKTAEAMREAEERGTPLPKDFRRFLQRDPAKK